jgi:glycosyltransferase involved in cell wall biosynthesis
MLPLIPRNERPVLGRRARRPRLARFLLICWYDPNGISTVYENIALWQLHSEFQLEILNLWPTRGVRLSLPPALDLREYDGVIIHATVSYDFGNLEALDSPLARPIEQYDGVKVLMKQDEQRMAGRFADYIQRKDFDVLLTCVPESELRKVYPRAKVGDIAFVHVLTGYVTPAMRHLTIPWSSSRPIGIGYRGSIQPLSFGRLGFEKRKIGYDVARVLAGRPGMRLDISSRGEHRLNGFAWIGFLTASQATLGVESGSNLFDFDGGVEAWCREFEAAHAAMDRLSEEFYRLADAEYLSRFEGNVDYAQVSPRHFEAAAARSVQVLYEGRYSDIFVPNRHFTPLARDLSNLEEVIETLTDERRCREITERAFADIIADPSYHCEAFVAKVDAALDAALARKGRETPHRRASTTARPRALILTASDPVLDPRTDCFAESLSVDYEVYEIGTYRFGMDGEGPSLEQLSESRFRLRVEPTRHGSWWIPGPATVDRSLSLGYQKLLYLAAVMDAPEPALRPAIGALDASAEDISQFRQLARHFLNANSALLEAAQRIGRFDLVVATDLDTLPAGVALRDETGTSLVYDAHEFWPYAWHDMRHWQCDFWASFSRGLVCAADLAITVSPPLAAAMADEYGREFSSLPNCASLEAAAGVDIEEKLALRAHQNEVLFLYQGQFAAGRGIDRLLGAWRRIDPRGRLSLRGPDCDYKIKMIELARSLELLDRTVFFPPAVAENKLITAASAADIGVIPYESTTINNRFACPNKLSQYLAAGLPVITNELDFVRAVLAENGIGFSVDFSNETATAALFNQIIAAANDIPPMARRARDYFEQQFHWERVFAPLRGRIRETEHSHLLRPVNDSIDLTWVTDPNIMQSRSSAETTTAQLLRLSTEEIARWGRLYATETARLNEVYSAEIARLQEIYSTEHAQLTEDYSTQITKITTQMGALNAELTRLQSVVSGMWMVKTVRLCKMGLAGLFSR